MSDTQNTDKKILIQEIPNIEHLDHASYKAAFDECESKKKSLGIFQSTDEEKRLYLSYVNEERALYEKYAADYSNAIKFFKGKNEKLGEAMLHIKNLLEEIKTDKGRFSNFNELAADFKSRTSISIEDFEKKLDAAVRAYDLLKNSRHTFTYSSAWIGKDNDLAQANFIYNSLYQFKAYDGYDKIASDIAYLAHYDTILENERTYYSIFRSARAQSKKIQKEFDDFQPKTGAVKGRLIISAIFNYILSQVFAAIGFTDYDDPIIMLALAAACVFSVTFLLPFLINIIRILRKQAKCNSDQAVYGKKIALEYVTQINKTKVSPDDVKYIAAYARSLWMTTKRYKEFIELNTHYCTGLSKYYRNYDVLSLYSTHFFGAKSFDDVLSKYNAQQSRWTAERKEREKEEREQQFRRDLINAVERAEHDRNAILAKAARSAEKTGEKMVEIEKERLEALKDALDRLR